MMTDVEYYGLDYISEVKHYGVGHLNGGHSGRYPWGSGDNPYQSDRSAFASLYSKGKESGKTDQELAKELGMTVKEMQSRAAMALRGKYEREGLSQKEIANKFGLSINEYRQTIAISTAEEKLYNIAWVSKLKNTGMSPEAISKETGIPASTVRDYLKPGADLRAQKINTVSEALKEELKASKYIQVGSGVEQYLGVSQTALNNALFNLQTQGYIVTNIQIQQSSKPGKEGQKTTIKVLAPPGTTYADVKTHPENIGLPFRTHINSDTGNIDYIQYPKSLDSSRIKIRYGDEDAGGFTGSDKDGVIELRRGVQDLSLGNSNYAQVRIMVDNNLYLKGMAMYSDNMPDGVDVIFNTNKKSGTPFESVLKPLERDENGNISDNPLSVFGATIKAGGQVHYIDKDGKDTIGVINKVNEEGDWDEWSRNLASQMLSKQSVQLAKKQLDLDYDRQYLEFQKIMDLDNPVVKKTLLDDMADDCDAKAVNLKAAALPGQRSQVLLPLPELKDNEIYAPNFTNGERVVLIRYPHGGTFEIPELIVNNNNKAGKSIIGQAKDAVGINVKTAEKLSGADFDGDTALVIPNPKGTIKTTKSLPGLVDFDPKIYKLPDDYEGDLLMDKKYKGRYMGVISNLITDMTLQGASDPELERAVRHSMVVIDAPKHRLNYQQSEKDNRIDELKRRYQRHYDVDPNILPEDLNNRQYGGAQTLISKSKSKEPISARKAGGYIYDKNGNPILNSRGQPKVFPVDPATGKKLYRETPETYKRYQIEVTNPDTGKINHPWVGYREWKTKYPDAPLISTKEKERTKNSTKMYEAEDAYILSSGTRMENTYAEYANRMKALGNQCRKESYAIPTTEKVNPEEKAKYSKEIASINEKLATAKRNEPLERQAQTIAYTRLQMRLSENDDIEDEKVARIHAQELTRARNEVGASGKESKIKLTENEWNAIQAGAVTTNVQKQVVRYSDKDSLRKLATPKEQSRSVTSAEKQLIKSMAKSGSSQKEIADALGISVSTVNKYLNE